MVSSTVGKAWEQELITTDSPRGEGSSYVRGIDVFSALIQFWQIWQNDLFTEKLECALYIFNQRSFTGM